MFPGRAFRGELSGAHHAGKNFGQAVRVTFQNVVDLKKKIKQVKPGLTNYQPHPSSPGSEAKLNERGTKVIES